MMMDTVSSPIDELRSLMEKIVLCGAYCETHSVSASISKNKLMMNLPSNILTISYAAKSPFCRVVMKSVGLIFLAPNDCWRKISLWYGCRIDGPSGIVDLEAEEESLVCLSLEVRTRARLGQLMESEFSSQPVSLHNLRNECSWWQALLEQTNTKDKQRNGLLF